ncbi:MAG: hypothetical protein OXI44_06525, partial [Bacteroidota bacterium]|nr:hypothetical protein [Bacteroidota bacterium]
QNGHLCPRVNPYLSKSGVEASSRIELRACKDFAPHEALRQYRQYTNHAGWTKPRIHMLPALFSD